MRGLPLAERLLVNHHLPRLIYAGPIGRSKDWRGLDHHRPAALRYLFTRYIYHLFDSDGDAVYFGKATTLSYRFIAHARKQWWREVSLLNLYAISCENHREEPCKGFGDNPQSTLDRAALLWERKAIADVQPRYNIAGVPA